MLRKWFGKKKDLPETGEETPRPSPPPSEAERSADAESARGTVSNEAAPGGAESAAPEADKGPRGSLFSRALEKTKKGLRSLFGFRRALDESVLAEIEAELYGADFGPALVADLLDGPDGVRKAWKDRRIEKPEEVREFLKSRLTSMLTRREGSLAKAPSPPTVILVAGVNGSGKTTSIAKLAKFLKDGGATVLLSAADTFRAAAVEQLTIWSQRLGVEIVTGSPGSDPGSVAYRSAERALELGVDYLIVDTAGRLHTHKNLMRELQKIRNVLGKKIPGAPHESLLVLDATTGQNALSQARAFQEEINVTGIILAKLDGTAKGGIVVTINNVLDVPVKFVGVGEKLADLEPFDVGRFVDALFE